MNLIDQIKRDELQALAVRLSPDHLAKVFGMTRSQLRKELLERGIKNSFEYLRELSQDEISHEIRRCGSLEATARDYHVSLAFLNSVLVTPPLKHFPVLELRELESAWNRFKSLKLIAAAYRCKISKLQAMATKLGLEKPDMARGESNISSFFGRQGELDYLRIRGLGPECDMTQKDPNHPFDVLDPMFGRVNVKSSNRGVYKQKSLSDREYHKFDLNGAHKCEHFAFMMYGKKGLWRVYILPTRGIEEKSLTINHKNRASLNPHLVWEEGKWLYNVWKV